MAANSASSTVKNITEWIVHAAKDVQRRAGEHQQHRQQQQQQRPYVSTDDIGLLPVLPSKQDRMLVLRAVLAVADQVEKERTTMPNDTSGGSPTQVEERKQYQRRLNHVLQEQLVPSATSALLLCDPVLKRIGDSEKEQLEEAKQLQDLCVAMADASALDPHRYILQDPYECMVLLVSNLVLHYGELYGGYDARIRNVVQRACIELLVQWMELRIFAVLDDRDDLDESSLHPELRDMLRAATTIYETNFQKTPADDKKGGGKGDEDTQKDPDVNVSIGGTEENKNTSVDDNSKDANDSTAEDCEDTLTTAPPSPITTSVGTINSPPISPSHSESDFLTPMDPSSAPLPTEAVTSPDEVFLAPLSPAPIENGVVTESHVPNASPKKLPPLTVAQRRRQLRFLASRKFLAIEQTIAGKMAALLLSNFQKDAAAKQRTAASVNSATTKSESSTPVGSRPSYDDGSDADDDVDEVEEVFEEEYDDEDDKDEDDDEAEEDKPKPKQPVGTTNLSGTEQTANKSVQTTNLSGTVTNANMEKMRQTMALVAKKQTDQMGLILIKNKKKIIRGLQITGVGAVAGTVLALTGGLAAPAIAAWIAGFGIATGTTASAVVAAVTTSQVIATIFGLGGGGLAAYKMKKRTAGLREFRLRREQIDQSTYTNAPDQILRRGIQASLPQLHTTICITGWLEDSCDFQTPWGIQPTDPEMSNKQNLLRRFFTVHDPARVETFQAEIKARRKSERKLFCWDAVLNELERQYGFHPEHLLPLELPEEQESQFTLTKPQQGMVSEYLEKIVLSKIYVNNLDMAEEKDPMAPVEEPIAMIPILDDSENPDGPITSDEPSEDAVLAIGEDGNVVAVAAPGLAKQDSALNLQASDFSWGQSRMQAEQAKETAAREKQEAQKKKRLAEQKLLEAAHQTPEDDEVTEKANEDCVVWDWHSIMGGDLHTLTWESEMLSGLSHIVETMATEVTTQTTKQVLGATAVGAIFAAISIPSAILTASQLIDDPYQIVILRADEAGIELARCLMLSEERRPVSLIGYSFGARVIFTCLRELGRHQILWEQQQGMSTLELFKHKRANRHKLDEGDVMDYIREPASIVQDAVFMGLPRTMDAQAVSLARYMVGGRFVNCYSRKDWLLSLMFLSRGGTQVCGTHPIRDVPGVENFNVSDVVDAHARYGDAVPKILRRIGPLC